MSQFQFRNLLRKYLNGQATPDEIQLIDRWYDKLNADIADQFTEQERIRLKARMWQQIDQQTTGMMGDTAPVRPLHRSSPISAIQQNASFWRVAAAVILLIGGWYGLLTYQNSRSIAFRGDLAQLSASLSEQRNTTDKPITLRLTDGSRVNLMPQSALRYPVVFAGKNRIVYLTGNAFFAISKDAQHPFRVISEKVVTQVLGTSFWVKAADRANRVEVEVRTGKVSVYERLVAASHQPAPEAGPVGVILTPNQKVTVNTAKEQWKTGLVAQPIVIQAEEKKLMPNVSFSFSETPLSVVLDNISEAYGIELTVTNPALQTCTFSGDLSRLPFYTQLELICKTVGATYDVQGTRILIKGQGCNEL